jgi:hypothetical protein
MTVATTNVGARAAAAPGANWAGWAGYTPAARGPVERLARATAAGLVSEGTMNVSALEEAVRPRCPGERRGAFRHGVTKPTRRVGNVTRSRPVSRV